MSAFRVLLGLMIVCVGIYTGIVILNHGWDLFSIFFGDMIAMNWAGQFNLDFLSFLILSGTWLAWRHHFSRVGMVLGVLGFLGGIMVLAPYLLIVSFSAKGDMREIFLGKLRAQNQVLG